MKPGLIDNVNLAPGEFFFGGGKKRIHTLLGSCVAITLWHPQRLIGGMCHYLLPSRGLNQILSEGHYADEAVKLFLRAIERYGSRSSEYEVKLFGGGDMFKTSSDKLSVVNVSRNNIEKGPQFLLQHGFKIKVSDLGGYSHRKIYFELWTGDVWVSRGDRCIKKARI